ncbi:MAG TPA: efflux RND transporter periplasmic adaptor subunit [Acidobacteriaceae bacterium]|nr:efflux RND transporter periplasmic adaptor subunit [Acidobacteriaceae bacterium]
MSKYVLRTSLAWIVVIAIGFAAFLLYRSHTAGSRAGKMPETNTAAPSEVKPVAEGPAAQPASGTADSGESDSTENSLSPVQISPQRMQRIGVKTGMVEYKPIKGDIRATGTVDIDQRLISYVQMRFPGYIRKVFANAIYQRVRKGQPLFTIYSPDLVATQQEFLFARENQKALGASTVDGVASGAAALSAAAEQRLQQWQVPQSEIARLLQTGKPIVDLTINSPVSGYITEYNALPNMYVDASTRLYTVADLSRVWVDAQVFQNQIGSLKTGDPADIRVDSYAGKTFTGRIDEILPQVDAATRTVRVRLVIANPGVKLKPGMYVDVDIQTSLGRQLTIPASAVLQTGTRQLVFLDHGDGSLDPKEVVLGPRTGDQYIILKGLKPHQRIVTSADFLIDSESQLQSAAGSFAPPPPGAGRSSPVANGAPSAQAKIDFTTDPNPPHKGANNFRVRLTNASGAPIAGAQVTVTFYMPAMPAMGMSAMKTTVALGDKGNGSYDGQGTLGSGGSWQVTVRAQQNGKVLARKLLHVNAEGGM